MKILNFSILIVVLSIFISINCAAQSSYYSNIDTAKQFYNRKEYLTAAKYYTYAFLSNHNLGFANHRYEAAQCWALNGQIDSAFYHLDRSVKANYDRYEELCTDTAFKLLRSDGRWPDILQRVRSNRLIAEQYLNPKFKNLNHILSMTLDSMQQDDQLPRLRMSETEKKYGWSSIQMQDNIKQMARNDSINTIKFRSILNKYGWLGKEEIGQQGYNTLILVLQHSNLATQQQYLPLLRSAVKQQKANPSNLALLEDRVALKQGRKQVYGSQIMQDDKTGKYYVQPLEDPKNVDKRRANVGLPPLREYVKQWGINWSLEQYEKDLLNTAIISIK